MSNTDMTVLIATKLFLIAIKLGGGVDWVVIKDVTLFRGRSAPKSRTLILINYRKGP